MRLAGNSTKQRNLKSLELQVSRAKVGAWWLYRNAEDNLKPDFKIVHEHLKEAEDEVNRLRDKTIVTWADKIEEPPIDPAKVAAISTLMPDVDPEDARKVMSILSELLSNHKVSAK